MAPQLYMVPASPPVRAVLMTAKALNLELEEVFVNVLEGEHLKDDFLKLNPARTVPTLVDNDGFVLWDSHAILGYLVAKYGANDDLYPKDDIKKRAIIDQRLHFDASTLFPNGRQISKPIIMGGKKEIPPERLAALKESYDILEKLLEGNQYAAGDDLTIADFSLVTTVTSWDVMVPLDDKKHKNIKAWIKRLQALPYYEQNQKGLEEFINLFTLKLSA